MPYTLALLLGFVLFSLLLKWQPVHSRLQLPLFVLGAPLAGRLLQCHARWIAGLGALLSLSALPYLLANQAHPLVGPASVLATDRVAQTFRQQPALEPAYVGAADFLRARGCFTVGLLLGSDDWEYPLWVLLPEARAGGRIEHVGVTSASGRLASPDPSFVPCAVVATTDPGDRLVVDDRSYDVAWSSPIDSSGATMRIYLPKS